MWLWTLFTAPYITQYIHSALVNNITTVLHTDVLCSIHMYCISCCNEAVEGPESRFSFYSFCLFLCFIPSFLYSFIYLQSYVFLCFSNSTFLSPFLPFLFFPYSLLFFFSLFLSLTPWCYHKKWRLWTSNLAFYFKENSHLNEIWFEASKLKTAELISLAHIGQLQLILINVSVSC